MIFMKYYKTLFFVPVLFFCLIADSNAALVMHLPLDGDLDDITTPAYNASIPSYTNNNPVYANAVFNQGLDFDGNDFIIAPSTADPGSTFSVSLWVRHDSIGALNTFIEHANNGNNHNDFYLGYDNTQNQLFIELEDTNSTEGGTCGNPKFCTGIQLTSNRWYHLTATVTPTTLKVYVDSELAYSTTHSTNVNFGNGNWMMGGDTDGNPVNSATTDFLDGRLDEIRVYSHELTQSEIDSLFGLLAFWKFDDCTISVAGDVTDSSASGYNGTPNNGVTNATGRVCTAGSFDGSDDYVSLPGFSNLTSNFTISAWIKPNAIDADQRIFVDDESNSNGFAFSLGDGGDGRLRLFSRNVSPIILDSSAVISTGNWHHVVAVHDSINKTRQIFVNGIDATSGAQTYTGIWGADNGLASIGGETDGAGSEANANWRFNGLIDEVKIFNRTLTTEEISDYNNNPDPSGRTCPNCDVGGSLVAYYELDEDSWSGLNGEIKDETGNFNGNRVGNAQTVATGKVCRAGEITANNRAINTTVDVNSNIGGTGTVAFWFRPNWTNTGGELNQGRVLFDASQAIPGNDPFFKLAKTNNNAPAGARERLAFLFEDSNDTDFQISTDTNLFQNGQWVYIAVTWDFPNDRFQLYTYNQSGTQIDFINQTRSTNGNIPNLASLYFGDNRSGYNPFSQTRTADGTFDEIRIHNQVLTQFEIESFMNATHSCGGLDHFSINYAFGASGTGVNCQAETITIEAHDSNHADLTSYVGTVNLTTNPLSNGDWSKTGTASDAFGTLTPGGSDSGTASYTFVAGDAGSIILNFKDTHTETATLNVADGLITETSNSAVANDDYQIAFASTGFNFLAGGVKDTIGLQIGGKPSSEAPGIQTLELQAIKTSDDTGACESVFQGATPVEITIECVDPTSCTGDKLYISTDNGSTFDQIDGTPELTYTSISDFDFGNATETTAPLIIRYDDVGKIKLHARKILTPSNEVMSGSSNEFVVRPFAFYPYITGNPAASLPTGTAFTTAGTDFTTNVRAVLWQSEDDDGSGGIGTADDGIADGHESSDIDPSNNVVLSDNAVANNYGQETTTEQVLLSALLNQPSGGNDPGLDDSSANGKRITSFTVGTGIGTSTTINYDEVGIIEISAVVNDNDYLGIGAAETSKIVGRSGYVGRFTPHHFDTSIIEGCTVSNNYTYSGQPFSVTALARNLTGAPTQNYQNTFAHVTTISNAGVSPVINFTNNTISAANFNAGIGTRTDVIYTFPLKETIPETITLRARDADTPTATGTEESTQIRSGRMRLENVFGSELSSLTMPLNIEYYSDNTVIGNTSDDGFILNTDDSCTSYDATAGVLTNYTGNLSTGETIITGAGLVASGEANIIFSTPGASNDGSVNLLANNVSSWLTYNWNVDCDNADADDDITTGIDAGLCGPSGIASFGLYRGDDRVIYWREVF